MADGNGFRWDGRIIFGLAILILGVLLLLRSIDPDLGETAWDFWPVVLILLGTVLLFQPEGSRQPLLGSALLIIGLLLILNNFEVIRLRGRDIWPVILILLGISILARNFRGRGKQVAGSDYFDLSLLLGGGKFKYDSKNFRGGKITTIMGGGEIDLYDAIPVQPEAVIDVMTIMGGVEIRVPSNWQVVMQGSPILGGMDNKTVASTGTATEQRPRLIVKGTAIMGGVEVKN